MTEQYPPRPPRVPFDRPVWLGSSDASGPLRRRWASNLSRGGIFIRTDDPLAVGTRVLIALDGRQEILPIAEGTVVWRRPGGNGVQGGVGIAFKTLKPDAGVLLDTLVESGGIQQTHPADSSVVWTEPKTPVLGVPRPREGEAEPPLELASGVVAVPGVGRVRLVALEGQLRLELEDGTVESVEHGPQSVTLKLR